MFGSIPILRAFNQQSNEVVVREPGSRLLSAPHPILRYAIEHKDFAWLSVAAYQKTPAGVKHANDVAQRHAVDPRAPGTADPDAAAPLTAAGWVRWGAFPNDGLLAKIKESHLRVEVWERVEPPAIAVTFGGTVFDNNADWRANLRWFLPAKRDEYSDVVQIFAPAFAEELARRLAGAKQAPSSPLTLYATGHSLGGGLAQQFAYALPLDSIKRVHKVYAFDPSPVTGFFSLPKRLRDHNKRGLLVDRIYERGEVLAVLRSLMSLLYKPSSRNATIRGIRYRVFSAWNGIAAHSIVDLASKIDAAARQELDANPLVGEPP